jgi:oligopeptide/dipeptide ABC transporter ATP-binding protein
MNNKEKSILELRNVTKTYKSKPTLFGSHGKDVVALNNISLEIFKGEIFGLVGESGSGKTTVGRLVVRLEDATAGSIELEGVAVTGLKGKVLKHFRRKIQMIFQDPYQSLNPQISIFDTVSEPLTIHRMGRAEAVREMTEEAMRSVGLSPPEDFLYRYPHQLSGGQRQRVAIARAMVLRPEFVVADEPTSMLDASISAQIFNILLDMRNNLDVTLMFITHSLAAARYLCDRIAVIYRGNIMELGPADDVIKRPRHPYTRALIDALPKFDIRPSEEPGPETDLEGIKHYGTLLKVERKVKEGLGCPFYTKCNVAHGNSCAREMPSLEAKAPSHEVACFHA